MASKKKPSKTIKVRLGCYIKNLGDGSAHPLFFLNEKNAEDYAENDDERFCDDVMSIELEFDQKGKLLNPSIKED